MDMIIFDGFLRDEHYPELKKYIAIDRFTRKTLESLDLRFSNFFLSHVHTDHMDGLFRSDSQGLDLLTILDMNDNSHLYCTPATKLFLVEADKLRRTEHHINEKKIKTLDYNESEYLPPIKIHSTDFTFYLNITVTCLRAPRHCSGSSMFLFEYWRTVDQDPADSITPIRRSLYTGDFRIQSAQEAQLILPDRFKNSDGTVLPIHDLYLDTTFWFAPLIQEFCDFPTQENSQALIVQLIRDWRKYNEENEPHSKLKIMIVSPGRYILEDLIVSLNREFETPIYLYDEQEFASYSKAAAARVEELERVACVAPDRRRYGDVPHDGFIHVCQMQQSWGYRDELRKSGPDQKAVVVKEIYPGALCFLKKEDKCWFKENDYGVPLTINNPDKLVHEVFYSTHCSRNELDDFIAYLRPQKFVVLRQNERNSLPSWKHNQISIICEQRDRVNAFLNNSQQIQQPCQQFELQQQLQQQPQQYEQLLQLGDQRLELQQFQQQPQYEQLLQLPHQQLQLQQQQQLPLNSAPTTVPAVTSPTIPATTTPTNSAAATIPAVTSPTIPAATNSAVATMTPPTTPTKSAAATNSAVATMLPPTTPTKSAAATIPAATNSAVATITPPTTPAKSAAATIPASILPTTTMGSPATASGNAEATRSRVPA